MIDRQNGLDIIKPKAAYMGGFAFVRVTDGFMDVVLAEAGEVAFTAAFSKRLG
jgi:cytolysin (calcineurin-like family phosphatase)